MSCVADICVICVGFCSLDALTGGWSTEIDEALIKATAKALVTSGMAKAGYSYVNIDDCWQVSRDANGTIVADPVRFPSGIPALASYIHSLGLLFGACLPVSCAPPF